MNFLISATIIDGEHEHISPKLNQKKEPNE